MSVEGIKKESVYREIDMLSASDLRLFATDRKKFFKKKVLKEEEPEEYNRAILIGNLCHTNILEPQKFDEKYLMSQCQEMPTGLMLAFTEALYRQAVAHTDSSGVIIADMETMTKAAWGESGFKITLEAVMKKFIGSNAEAYYKELRESRSKGLTVVCVEDLDIATAIETTIRGDEHVGPIFNMEADNKIVFNELQVENIPAWGILLKAQLDKVIVDHGLKTIQLLDLKCVWNNQDFYYEYYLKKLAYVQALIYYTALFSRKADLGFDYTGYEIKMPIFVVADSSNFYAPLQYRLTVDNLEEALEGFKTENGRKYMGVREIIEEMKWCQETNQWRLSKKAFDNNGIVDLKQ